MLIGFQIYTSSVFLLEIEIDDFGFELKKELSKF
jgi:hypothetical protein